jgi:hypothetical protein
MAFKKRALTDKSKPRMSLIDPTFLENVGAVLTEGAEEYGDYNWQECNDANKFIDAAVRHLLRIWSVTGIRPSRKLMSY